MATANKKKTAAKKAVAPASDELQRHPLSERYGPAMAEDELQGLAADIKAHKQHEPIITYEGMVLAGWNRYRACLLAGVKPKTREMDEGSNPSAVAFGTNFLRRRLSTVQKAFYGAQFCLESGEKQADVARLIACNLNRLNQCCQLLKLETPEAKKAVVELRDSSDMGSAQFDELMLELGITRPSQPRPARGGGALDNLDDDDPLGDDLGDSDDDLSAGAIDKLIGDGDELGDEETPNPATRKGKKTEVGDDLPIPAVGTKRSSMANPHETPVSRVAKAFRALSEAEQRQFVKFAWKGLRVALDAAIGGADVEYTPPATIKADPSRIARKRDEVLDDGAPAPKGKGKKGKPAPPAKKAAAKKTAPAKKSSKHAAAHDNDI